MKAYLAVTATLFGLVTLAHLWRVHAEGAGLGREPWYVLITVVTAVLSVWGYRLLLTTRTRP